MRPRGPWLLNLQGLAEAPRAAPPAPLGRPQSGSSELSFIFKVRAAALEENSRSARPVCSMEEG